MLTDNSDGGICRDRLHPKSVGDITAILSTITGHHSVDGEITNVGSAIRNGDLHDLASYVADRRPSWTISKYAFKQVTTPLNPEKLALQNFSKFRVFGEKMVKSMVTAI